MLSYENLKNAYETLVAAYNDFVKNENSIFAEYIADSCVKRFEYTLETSWKLAKKIFIQKFGKSEQELSMNNVFRLMQGYGYCKNWENWREYYQKRNEVAHEYNLFKARTLIDVVPNFIKDVEFFLNKLKEEDLNAD